MGLQKMLFCATMKGQAVRNGSKDPLFVFEGKFLFMLYLPYIDANTHYQYGTKEKTGG
jgi:hypothetical protein